MEEPSASAKVTKLDVAERHILASIQLIAVRANPFSTHLPVMACEELLYSLSDAAGVLIEPDYRMFIKDEYHDEYRSLWRSAYNYFKHADRDAAAIYSGPSDDDLCTLNEMTTVFSIMRLYRLSKRWRSYMGQYIALMMVKNPKIVKDLTKFEPEFQERYEQVRGLSGDAWYAALRDSLFRANLLPRIPYQRS
jgi:hypothetical protein